MFGMTVVLAMLVSDPCALITTADIARTIGWDTTRGHARHYSLPATSGTMCSFDGRDGTVMVTVAPRGDGLPINGATNGLAPVRNTDELRGLGMTAEIGADTVLVRYRSHDYGIQVSSVNAQFADPLQLTELAKAMVRRIRASVAHRA